MVKVNEYWQLYKVYLRPIISQENLKSFEILSYEQNQT